MFYLRNGLIIGRITFRDSSCMPTGERIATEDGMEPTERRGRISNNSLLLSFSVRGRVFWLGWATSDPGDSLLNQKETNGFIPHEDNHIFLVSAAYVILLYILT
jgi:hypothetical protein